MTIFDDIRRDHEAGTPGPWEVKYQGETHLYMNGDSQMCDMTYYPWVPDETADWERIARVPELERIALAAEELAKVFPDIVGYLEGLIEDGCPKCGGDCSGANPPVSYCPMKSMNNDLARANAAIAKLREASK